MIRRAPQRRSRQLSQSSVVSIRVTSYRTANTVPQRSNLAAVPLPVTLKGSGVPFRKRSSVAVAIPELRASVSAGRLTLSLPIPPSINHQYATVNGRRLLSAAGRGYKATVAHQVMVALGRYSHKTALLRTLRESDLALTVRFYFASPLRRDVDSGLKIAQDALCEALGLNDNRIVEIHLYKSRDVHDPRIEMTLGAL